MTVSADATALADPTLYMDPGRLHATFTRLRTNEPVALAAPDGFRPFYVVTRHADIRSIERQDGRYAAGPRTTLMPIAHEEANLAAFGTINGVNALTMLDGEYHRKLRALTQDHFLPRNVDALAATINMLAASFVEDMIARGDECDFATDVAFWFPLRVVMTMMGIPPADEARLLRLTQQLFGANDSEYARKGETGHAHIAGVIGDYMRFFERITADRRAYPTDDLSSVIANAVVDGAELSPLNRLSYYMILATAGHDTTSGSISGGLLALVQNPDQLRSLLSGGERAMRGFVNETIRWSAPVKHFMRTAQEDCEFSGVGLRRDASLLLSYAAACRDERIFEDPDRFRIDRDPNNHLAFGHGPHQCLGQYMARLEIAAFHRAFWRRIASVELTGRPEYVASSFVSGLKRLPVRFRTR